MPSPTTLPARVDSSILAKHLTAGEPVVLVKLVSVGNTAPYDFRDAKGSRAYVFRWDLKAGGHILRVPLHLWQANKAQIAHDIMDQRRLPNAIVVTVELPQTLNAAEAIFGFAGWLTTRTQETIMGGNADCAVVAGLCKEFMEANKLTPPRDGWQNFLTHPTEKGATDTANEGDVQNVVGLSQASPPTVALASEEIATDEQPAPVATDEPQEEAPADEPPPQEEAPAVNTAPLTLTSDTIAGLAFDNVEQPKRIKALAAILGVEEEVLRAAIESPGSKVELAKAGWVRRKES